MQANDSREMGIGVVYSIPLARVLDLTLVDVLEVEPQMFWRPMGRAGNSVSVEHDLFAGFRAMRQQKLVHSVGLPIGNSRPHPPEALERLRQSIAALDAPYATEHLSFDRFSRGTERLWTGFLLPPRQDAHTVAIAADRIEEMRTAVGVPVAFETGVNYLRPMADELSDGLFVRAVAEAADCGILLDLHNLLANERNGREAMGKVLGEIPLERVWEIHLAGGMEYRGYWLDSHSGHIEDELFTRARAVVAECPNLRAIVFEIMPAHVAERSAIRFGDDLRLLRALWAGRRRARIVDVPRVPRMRPSRPSHPVGMQRREDTLGEIAHGRVPPRDAEAGLREDPGVLLYADLTASMREGALHDVVPSLIRALIDSIGPASLMAVITAFHAETPPQPFGADEARRFIAYLRARQLDVPHLSKSLDVAESVIEASGSGETDRALLAFRGLSARTGTQI